mgnify:FL=1|jgi:hypothetical protein
MDHELEILDCEFRISFENQYIKVYNYFLRD